MRRETQCEDNYCLNLLQAEVTIVAGYGSTKDISVYSSLGLPPSQIYIVGRAVKKLQNQCQVWSLFYRGAFSSAVLLYQRMRARGCGAHKVTEKPTESVGSSRGGTEGHDKQSKRQLP